jgi:thioredoxin
MEKVSMVTFDTPINVNDQNWQKVLQQNVPLLLCLFDRADARLDDELKRIARTNAGQLLVVRVNASENPQIYARYNHPALPALVAIRDGAVQATAAPAQVSDINAYSAYLLGKGPKPAVKSTFTGTDTPFTVTDSTFQRDVLQSDLPVLVDFWAPWCAPCHMIAPVVEQLAKKYAGCVKVAKLNVDENPRTASQYRAISIPMLILFKQSREASRLVGAQPQVNIERMITSALQGA